MSKAELVALLEERQRRQSGRKFWSYYPDEGPLRRGLYPKHMKAFEAGLFHKERCVMAGNRVGKSEGIGAFEVACHLTGLYPDWWPGHRFIRPINALCGGDTNSTTRDIIVRKLCGPAEDRGTGMIPRECLGTMTGQQGIPGSVDIARVRHVTGGWSSVQFRSYDQGRVAWQGTEREFVWMDEEPPEDIYTEAVMRTMTTQGLVLCTFTPLSGVSNVVLSFLPELAPAV